MHLRWIPSTVVAAVVLASVTCAPADEPSKPIRVGIIGTTTSHVPAFTNLINDADAEGVLADVEVVAAFIGGIEDNPSSWDRREQYANELEANGCTIYDTIDEMLEHVDAVLLEEVDGRPHLEWARLVIAAGKPLFVDKPMAGSLVDVIEIFRLAREAGVPCFSSSSLRYSSGFQAAHRGEPFGAVEACTAWSPMFIEPHHPDLFWYGIHGVETLFTIMGTGCETVTRVEENRVVGVWEDGRVGTFVGREDYGAEVQGTKSSGSAGDYEGYEPLVIEICRFLKTGKPPVTEEETLEIYTFMEAADESKRQGGATVILADVLEQARRANAARR